MNTTIFNFCLLGKSKSNGQGINRTCAKFLLALSLFTPTIVNAQNLKPAKVAEARQRIWAEWQRSQASSVRTNIPSQALTNDWFFTWNLPADLEPNAEWNYYWGYKAVSTSATDSTTTGAFANGAKEKLPLFIYLHGSGPRDIEWKTGYKLAQFFQDGPSYYYIPQIPQEGPWYRWYQRSKQWAYERLLRLALASGSVDPDRIYMFGISEGGYGSQRLASFYADYLAGAGPMAGGEPLKNAPVENCCNIGFSLLTGAQDKGFYRDELTYCTQQAFDQHQLRHPDMFRHRINLIPGRGHQIDYRPTTQWLKHFTRQAQPKHFMWEDFEMDGRHREGFYNLQVLERSHPENSTNDRGRQYYTMNIQGQNIDITVHDITYTTVKTDTIWGIEMQFDRQYTPSHRGKLRIYLSEDLIDLKRPVTITLNQHRVFSGRLQCSEHWLRESLQLFGDPRRLFPAAVDIEIE